MYAQRKIEGLRAFAQSLSNAGLERDTTNCPEKPLPQKTCAMERKTLELPANQKLCDGARNARTTAELKPGYSAKNDRATATPKPGRRSENCPAATAPKTKRQREKRSSCRDTKNQTTEPRPLELPATPGRQTLPENPRSNVQIEGQPASGLSLSNAVLGFDSVLKDNA